MSSDARDVESASKDSSGLDEDKATSPQGVDESHSAPAEEEKAEEKTDAPAPPQNAGPGPPPNGGLVAWLQVLGSWMLFFNTFGILNTFGVYQTYYESGRLWHESSSNISWIGSIQSVMVVLGGTLAGPLYDRGYLRTLLIVGSFLVVFGHMMLSITHTFWESILAQGFVIGIGGACLFTPGVAILPAYFTTKLGLVIGLAASGSSMGGIIYPIMFYKLIDKVGFGWSVRILGFTALGTLLIAIAVMRMRVKPGKARSIIDWSAFTDGPYMLFVFGAVVGFIGLYVGLFYTSFYGQATGLTDASLSFYLVPILNAGSVFGRTLPNWLSDKVGPLNVVTPGALLVGIVLFCYLTVKTASGLCALAFFFGFTSGIFIAMPPVVFVALTKDKSKIGTRIGMGFAMIGIGVLCGGPGGGAILGQAGGNLHWTSTWVYAGVTALAAGVTFLILRFIKVGFKIAVKI